MKANPFLEPHKFGLTTHQVDMLAPLMDEADRNARAYGWEIGHGSPLVPILDFSPENPFTDPNWRDNVRSDVGEAEDEAVSTSGGGDQQSEQREDPVRQRWGREITYGSGVLPDEGGTG